MVCGQPTARLTGGDITKAGYYEVCASQSCLTVQIDDILAAAAAGAVFPRARAAPGRLFSQSKQCPRASPP